LKKSIDEYYNCVDISCDIVRHEPRSFFVGVVQYRHPTHKTWCIRNPAIYHMDVFIDEEAKTGNVSLLLTPGDLVAVRLDPRIDRWVKKGQGDLLFLYQACDHAVRPCRRSVELQRLRARATILTVDDFSTAKPALLETHQQRACSHHPVGRVVSVLQRAILTAIPGRTATEGAHIFVPAPWLRDFPTLRAQRYASGNVAALETRVVSFYAPRDGNGKMKIEPVSGALSDGIKRFGPLASQQPIEITLSDLTSFGYRMHGAKLFLYFPVCFDCERLTGNEQDQTLFTTLRFAPGQQRLAVELSVTVSTDVHQTPIEGRFVVATVRANSVPEAHRPQLENMANFFAAHYLWEHLPHFAVFVRTTQSLIEDTNNWSTSAETTMLPETFPEAPRRIGTSEYKVYANATRFSLRTVDQLTAALLTMAVLAERKAAFTEAEMRWLTEVPRIRALIGGWALAGHAESAAWASWA